MTEITEFAILLSGFHCDNITRLAFHNLYQTFQHQISFSKDCLCNIVIVCSADVFLCEDFVMVNELFRKLRNLSSKFPCKYIK